ncbi:MAG TPA: hypothetical protein VN442_19930 [Bryobacteraceae bacterium]|nr:hypothetical protein [Bryobacteraceae bacterium]
MISRRTLLRQAAGLAASPLLHGLVPVASHEAAHRHGKRVTLLRDGGFEHGAWGWETTEGAAVDPSVAHTGGASMRIRTDKGDYARFLVLNPRTGVRYTLCGWVKTERVRALAEGGGAFWAASQFEFAGRPSDRTDDGHIEEQHHGNVVGDSGWQRFHLTVPCREITAWFEVTLGIYRGAGTAWFDDITLVEDAEPAELSEVVEASVAAQWAHAAVLETRLGRRPCAAILRDRIPVRGKASDPEHLAHLLAESYETFFLTAADLSRPEKFHRRAFDLLVLPYGESFPLGAHPALRDFLSQGGDLFTTGGYAFLSPVLADGTFDDEQAEKTRGPNLVPNGAFTGTAHELLQAGWSGTVPEACTLDTAVHALKVMLPPGAWGRAADWRLLLPAEGIAKRFYFEAEIRAEGIDAAQGGYGYASLEQLNARGYPVYAMPAELKQVTGTGDWVTVRETIALSPETRKLRLRFGLTRTAGTLWVQGVRLEERGTEPRINTAKGFPQDELRILPEQIGMFDPDYRLRRVAYAEPAPKQAIFSEKVRLEAPFTGYAASGVLGINDSRWIPLLNTYDRFGRLRGAAGALMHNYGGFYSRGSWAFFGVDNQDLFGSGKLDGAVRSLARTLARKCYLHEIETDFRCYRDGEPVRLRVEVSNYGIEPRTLGLHFEITPTSGGEAVLETTREVRLAAGERKAVLVEWKPARFTHSRYRVEARLTTGAEVIDRIETGFEVWKEETLAAGTSITSKENYIHLNGQPVFTQGTDDYLYMFLDRHENPLTMQADADGCRDACVDIYENLVGLRGPQHNPPRQWWRSMDAMSLAIQRAGGIFMPGMLIFSNTAVSHADLDEQKTFCRRFAERYRQVKGLIYYINGDLELHNPNLPDLQKLYREYLRGKYGTDEALRAAWTLSPPEAPIDQLRIARGKYDWRDVRSLDEYRFRLSLLRRWLGGLAEAIRSADASHPITAEFYQGAGGGLDPRLASDSLDFANFGYFADFGNDRRRFPAVLKLLDLGLKGKGAHVGEFGVKTHPAWTQATSYLQARPESYEHNFFLEITHTAFGQGGAKVQNWSWKYPSNLPFSWGMHYPCDGVPRDVLAYYRNSGILFRGFRPKWSAAPTVLLLPTESRQSGNGHLIHESLLNALRILIDARVPVSTLDDNALDLLPKGTEAILYPLSYSPGDEVIERLEAFVRQGGRLYLSGDISFDALRRRVKTDRLERLCGVAFEQEIYPELAFGAAMREVRPTTDGAWPAYSGAPSIRVRAAGARVLAATADGIPVLVEHKLGEGRVVFSTDPLELHAPDGNPDAPRYYAALLERLGIKPERLTPAAAPVHLYRVATHDGETVHVAQNYGDTDLASVEVPLPDSALQFSLPAHRPAAAAVNSEGSIIALEGAGEMRQGDELLLRAGLHLMAIALDRKPLTRTTRLLLLPMGTGEIEIPNPDRWRKPKVVTGEVVRGRWKSYESFEPARDGNRLRVTIDPDRNLSMLLVAEAGDESGSAALVEERVMRPWDIQRNA